MIGIINYGSGNIEAIANVIKFAGIPYVKLNCIRDFDQKITHLLLPGVGGFDETMDLLESKYWTEWLDKMVLIERIPIMGICVGMQILFESSSEGSKNGLGWMPGKVIRISSNDGLPLPHMGWNSISSKSHPIFNDIDFKTGFYFLHNYYACPDDDNQILATSKYKIDVPAVVSSGNILGVQFHPEKSLSNGSQLISNFYSFF